MDDLIDRLITLGVVLGFWAVCYIVRLFAGFKNVRKQMKKWNWSQFFDGLFDRFCWLIATGGAVVACEMLKWLMPLIGVTFSGEVVLLLDTASVIAIPFVNGIADLVLGIKSIRKSSGWENNAKALESQFNGEINYEEIAKPVREFMETITDKTSKEQFEEDEVDEELLEGEELPDELAGMGGFANTYPEPYCSKPQDSMLDPSKCWNRECVSYCAWKIAELTGKWPVRTGSMNAKNWIARLAENGYSKVVANPENGGKYIGVSEAGTYGHVVWFEYDNVITEYNYSIRGGFSVREINLFAYKWVEIKAPEKLPATTSTTKPKATTTKKTVTYTYKAGDTFGQVIKDLGLATSHGLWDPADGDVAYYTNQLHEQGIWGNIPVGTTIKLAPRK